MDLVPHIYAAAKIQQLKLCLQNFTVFNACQDQDWLVYRLTGKKIVSKNFFQDLDIY